MNYFAGIDVSLRFVAICVVDEAGLVQYEEKVAAEAVVVARWLDGAHSAGFVRRVAQALES